jgi:O-antigen ligase
MAAPAALAAADGGYFPERYGLAGVAFLLVAAVALLLRDTVEWGPLDAALTAALTALVGWTALSAVWAPTAGPPLQEAQRTLAYAAAALAGLLIVRSGGLASLASGILAGICTVALVALATRLLPGRLSDFEPVEGYQLAEPIGYWNALGILVVVGLVLAAGFAAHADGRPARVAAAAAVPVLAAALAFTFSRGSWIALAIGLAALTALDPGRARLSSRILLLAPAPVLAVAISLRLDGLTERSATLEQARHDALVLAPVLAGASLLAVGIVLASDAVERRLELPAWVARAYAGALATVGGACIVVALFAAGGPVELVERAHDSFTAPLPRAAEPELGARLASFSGNGRAEYWRVAWRVVEDEPALGAGAGTYERAWLEQRPVAFPARDAHNLYLELLAELGPVGLALLAAAFAVPLIALARARVRPAAAAAGAAYVAFLSHAAVDWDWEVPAVTATAVLLGVGLVACARSGRPERQLRPLARVASVAVVAIVLTAATAAQLGNTALASAEASLGAADAQAASSAARRAQTLVPWSAEPWRLLGEAQVLAGNQRAGLHSLREAARRDPGDWRVWYDLALAGEPGAAARAASLNPLAPELSRLGNPP